MGSREERDRRGRSERGAAGLLDREYQLAAIEAILGHAREGRGEALLIEGHVGIGKTRLHEAALDSARQLGFRVMRAAGAELERHMAFGIAAQLLTTRFDELSSKDHQAMLADRARSLVSDSRGGGNLLEGSDLSLVHSVFTVVATDDQARPTLLAIEDLHWCDTASLEFVLYLLHRLDELPMALVMTRRTGMGEEVSDVLDRIATHPRVRIETLAPLGPGAVSKLAWRLLGERADPALVQACMTATAGNPFFLRELLVALQGEGDLPSADLARRAQSLVPEAVIRALRVRVGRLGQSSAALARAIVVLGDDVPLRQAATLARLDMETASGAADSLAGVEILLAREPLRFVHPLVRQALEQDIASAELATRHFQAARLLHAERGGAERVAAHLLLSHRRGDPWVVEQLRAAAREARGRAVPRSAVRYLQRALEEPPADEVRADLLAELGAAEAAAGDANAADRFAAAMAASQDPRRRAQLALHRGRALSSRGLAEQAAQSFEAGLAELPAQPSDADELELRDQLQADYVVVALLVPALQARALALSADLLDRAAAGPVTQGQRLRLAQVAQRAVFEGEPAPEVLDLVEQAWDAGRLLECGTSDGIGWRLVSGVCMLAGDLEQAVQVADAALEDARKRGWPFAFATATLLRALPLVWQGRIDDAISEFEIAREARRVGWRQYARVSAAFHALALIEKGTLDLAEQILLEDAPLDPLAETSAEVIFDLEDSIRLYALAELRLVQGRAAEALDSALSSGGSAERIVKFFGYCPWRTTAAQALLTLGDRERALELAEEAAARARRIKVLHQRVRTQRVLGLCQGGEKGLKTLEATANLAADAPPRLETVKALIELGAALRRANQRVAAREPLQRAADMAWAGGASALHERARMELAATGARPRRVMLLSGPDSLTPSERRIAELAAVGHSNREIAQALFVTPKTVEYHLRNAYRKLDIDGRENLSTVLVA